MPVGTLHRTSQRPKDAGGIRTHLDRVAAGCRTIWLQRQLVKCPRQELNLVLNLRKVTCDPAHSKDVFESTPPRN